MPQEVTSASQWRAKEDGFVVTLPSGNVAKLRRTLNLMVLLKTGQIPNSLRSVIGELIQGKRQNLDTSELSEQQVGDMMQMVDDALPSIFIEPRLVATPAGEDEFTWEPDDPSLLPIRYITLADRMFAFGFAQGGPADLERFRAQQGAGVAAVPASEVPADSPVEPS